MVSSGLKVKKTKFRIGIGVDINMNHVEAIIFDWAGTTVDYGCFAPVSVFMEIFKNKGITLTMEEVRQPMGLSKVEHIRVLLQMERVRNEWISIYGKAPEEQDVQEMYADFEPMLMDVLPQYSEVIPGVAELVDFLEKKNIKIGSTTGYTAEMMKVVSEQAKKNGYAPHTIVTPNDVPAGRPYPWMCYKNALNLQVYPLSRMVKVGDTVSDILEGRNAGMWSIGVLKGGSELGLSQQEVEQMDSIVLKERMKQVKDRFKRAGAHYVIDEISHLPSIIHKIEALLHEKGNNSHVYG